MAVLRVLLKDLLGEDIHGPLYVEFVGRDVGCKSGVVLWRVLDRQEMTLASEIPRCGS